MRVSIQLVSPASGEAGIGTMRRSLALRLWVSIQLVSPASGEILSGILSWILSTDLFPFN